MIISYFGGGAAVCYIFLHETYTVYAVGIVMPFICCLDAL